MRVIQDKKQVRWPERGSSKPSTEWTLCTTDYAFPSQRALWDRQESAEKPPVVALLLAYFLRYSAWPWLFLTGAAFLSPCLSRMTDHKTDYLQFRT